MFTYFIFLIRRLHVQSRYEIELVINASKLTQMRAREFHISRECILSSVSGIFSLQRISEMRYGETARVLKSPQCRSCRNCTAFVSSYGHRD